MMSGALTDDSAVLGEPASQPHQAAVVGEPPGDISPVLGEPVLLSNGMSSDRPPVSASSPVDGTAINGVGESNAIAPEFRDASLPFTRPNAEEPAASEEARAEEVTRPSAIERVGIGPESRPMNADAMSAEIEVTHLLDDPSHTSHPGSELPIDNPSSSLEPLLQEADDKSSDDAEGPSASSTSRGDGDQVASAAEEKESSESSGESVSALALPDAIPSEKVSIKDGDDDNAVPDSSLSQFDNNVSVDSVPVGSSGQRSIPIEESTDDKSCTDKSSFDEDGYQGSENTGPFNGGKPSAEAEKSSHIKLPVIFTVVVAVVGVFAISISRSRQ